LSLLRPVHPRLDAAVTAARALVVGAVPVDPVLAARDGAARIGAGGLAVPRRGDLGRWCHARRGRGHRTRRGHCRRGPRRTRWRRWRRRGLAGFGDAAVAPAGPPAPLEGAPALQVTGGGAPPAPGTPPGAPGLAVPPRA